MNNSHTIQGRRPSKALCASLLAAILIASPTQSFAQQKNLVANTKPSAARDLDSKEADLLKKEADLLKQLSVNSKDSGKASLSRTKIETPVKPGPFDDSKPIIFKGNEKVKTQEAPVVKEKVEVAVVKEKAPVETAALVAPHVKNDSEAVIAQKDRQIEALSQEVTKLRNRLLLAETEVERLSSIIDERNRRQMTSYSGSSPSLSANKVAEPKSFAPRNTTTSRSTSFTAPDSQDMQVVTVRADKAFLRTGPGEENSPLMTVSRGTRLAVETRNGNWYRIISPAGTRAWVAAEVVVFGDTDPSRATRIGGVR